MLIHINVYPYLIKTSKMLATPMMKLETTDTHGEGKNTKNLKHMPSFTFTIERESKRTIYNCNQPLMQLTQEPRMTCNVHLAAYIIEVG